MMENHEPPSYLALVPYAIIGALVVLVLAVSSIDFGDLTGPGDSGLTQLVQDAGQELPTNLPNSKDEIAGFAREILAHLIRDLDLPVPPELLEKGKQPDAKPGRKKTPLIDLTGADAMSDWHLSSSPNSVKSSVRLDTGTKTGRQPAVILDISRKGSASGDFWVMLTKPLAKPPNLLHYEGMTIRIRAKGTKTFGVSLRAAAPDGGWQVWSAKQLTAGKNFREVSVRFAEMDYWYQGHDKTYVRQKKFNLPARADFFELFIESGDGAIDNNAVIELQKVTLN